MLTTTATLMRLEFFFFNVLYLFIWYLFACFFCGMFDCLQKVEQQNEVQLNKQPLHQPQLQPLYPRQHQQPQQPMTMTLTLIYSVQVIASEIHIKNKQTQIRTHTTHHTLTSLTLIIDHTHRQHYFIQFFLSHISPIHPIHFLAYPFRSYIHSHMHAHSTYKYQIHPPQNSIPIRLNSVLLDFN